MEIVVPDEFKYLYVRNDERPVVKIPDPVLRKVAGEVPKVGKKQLLLIDDMIRIMKLANGVGLAAPQVGILQRIIVIAPDGMRPTALINPKVVKSDGLFIGQEGCLSIPGLYGDVTRPDYVEVEALDRRGREVVFELEGMPAKVVQHEIDHLDGVLFIDKVDMTTLHWSHPSSVEHDANE
jgi:peptide deformylase